MNNIIYFKDGSLDLTSLYVINDDELAIDEGAFTQGATNGASNGYMIPRNFNPNPAKKDIEFVKEFLQERNPSMDINRITRWYASTLLSNPPTNLPSIRFVSGICSGKNTELTLYYNAVGGYEYVHRYYGNITYKSESFFDIMEDIICSIDCICPVTNVPLNHPVFITITSNEKDIYKKKFIKKLKELVPRDTIIQQDTYMSIEEDKMDPEMHEKIIKPRFLDAFIYLLLLQIPSII